jgi:hypothetical protein
MDKTLFTHVLAIVPHLFLGGLSGMVYERLLGCFTLEDPSLGFLKLFQNVSIIASNDIFKLFDFNTKG